MERLHHLYVSIAKQVFRHRDYGMVRVPDPITLGDAASYGLSPVLLYGITVAGLPYRIRYYSDLAAPRDLGEVLSLAWADASWLKGLPDRIMVSKHLAGAAPGLADAMDAVGVDLQIAGPREKSLPASMRSAQTGYLMFLKGGPEEPLKALEAAARQVDEPKGYRTLPGGLAMQKRAGEWDALENRGSATFVRPIGFEQGPWLRSWEASVPPPQDRYFYIPPSGDFFHESVSLLIGDKSDFDEDDEDDGDEQWSPDDDYPPSLSDPYELVKSILACWPLPEKDVADAIGVTVRELKWYVSGRAMLPHDGWRRLCQRFTLEPSDGNDYDIAGPLVLVARKRRHIEDCWVAMTSGGDSHPVELVPALAEADPSWRYFLVNRDNDRRLKLVIAPRGSDSAELVESTIAMNYRGRVAIPDLVYKATVEAVGIACRSTNHNSAAIRNLMYEHGSFWDQIEDWSRAHAGPPSGCERIPSPYGRLP
ncbi:hypothetical protein [Sphingopyxis sp. FD7]|uniref:hypothetical protein n=1 Tax=Sphingopyxis sp. FD7 TaxID=1914525 RepID=UPI0011BA61E6|nr:hypothetical protein [Sphingopyxis sp. FD7]